MGKENCLPTVMLLPKLFPGLLSYPPPTIYNFIACYLISYCTFIIYLGNPNVVSKGVGVEGGFEEFVLELAVTLAIVRP
jgi:hypothetical protein